MYQRATRAQLPIGKRVNQQVSGWRAARMLPRRDQLHCTRGRERERPATLQMFMAPLTPFGCVWPAWSNTGKCQFVAHLGNGCEGKLAQCKVGALLADGSVRCRPCPNTNTNYAVIPFQGRKDCLVGEHYFWPTSGKVE